MKILLSKICVVFFVLLLFQNLSASYDPKSGRWLSRDPIGESGGINLYAYCNNDPINGVDYLGLAGYFFDGTANHPHKRNIDGTPNYKTNIRILFEAYNGENRAYAYGIGSGYYADGTPYTETERGPKNSYVTYESMTGTTMEARVDYMIKELEKNLAKGDKVIDLFGFSRGAASATWFLNKVQAKIDSEEQLYQGIEIRFVSLFDQVPSHSNVSKQTWGRYCDTWGYCLTLTMCNPDTYARNANNANFNLPAKMDFTNKPIHLVALDEQRKEFACSNLTGAWQVGFRGVHSNLGGGYGGSLFEFIAREFVIETAQGYGLDLFNSKKLKKYDGPYRKIYNLYKNKFDSGNLPKIPCFPTDNSTPHFNDHEPRSLPPLMELHPSVDWFDGAPYNRIRGINRVK